MSQRSATELRLRKEPPRVAAYKSVNGSRIAIAYEAELWVRKVGKEWIRIRVAVPENLEIRDDLLIGHDVHDLLGSGVVWTWTNGKNKVEYLPHTPEQIGAVLEKSDDEPHGSEESEDKVLVQESSDHTCRKQEDQWIAEWKWVDNPPKNYVQGPEYYPKVDIATIQKQMDEWCDKGIIEPVQQEFVKFVLPINPIVSTSVHKSTQVRITLDFTKLNEFIKCHKQQSTNEDSLQCIRVWRQYTNGTLIDLKKAYHSVAMAEELTYYQCVKFEGKYYRCRRLMFGLNVAPRILFTILTHALNPVHKEVRFFRDDLFVTNKETVQPVLDIMQRNGFQPKDPVLVGTSESVRVLGLTVQDDVWSRAEDSEGQWELPEPLTAESALSWIGTIGNIAPVQNWLRVMGSHIRRAIAQQANAANSWKTLLDKETVQMIQETLRKLREGNPMKGKWKIEDGPWKLYTDASNEMLGAVLVSNGSVVADWCKSVKKLRHPNFLELEALLSGVTQLALKYIPNKTHLVLVTDNSSVYSWVRDCLQDLPLKSQAMHWPLIEARLDILKDIVNIRELKCEIELIGTAENPADALTRKITDKTLYPTVGAVSMEFSPIPETTRKYNQRGLEVSLAELVKNVHLEMLHPSSKMAQTLVSNLAHGRFTEEEISEEIRNQKSTCTTCWKKTAKLPKEEYKFPCSTAVKFGEVIQIDTCSIDSVKYIGIIDMGSRFAHTYICENGASSLQARNALQNWLAITGIIPKIIRADNGPEFQASFITLAKELGCQIRNGAIGNPRSQALVERFNRSLISLVRCQESGTITEKILRALRTYNLRPHSAFAYKLSPLGAKTILVADGKLTETVTLETSDEESAVEEEDEPIYDPEGPKLKIGDTVLWRDSNSKKKSEFPYRDATITNKFGRGSYEIKVPTSNKLRVVNYRDLVPVQILSPERREGSKNEEFQTPDDEDNIQTQLDENEIDPGGHEMSSSNMIELEDTVRDDPTLERELEDTQNPLPHLIEVDEEINQLLTNQTVETPPDEPPLRRSLRTSKGRPPDKYG